MVPPPLPHARAPAADNPARPQSSEQRLYTFSPDTKAALRKFRLGTSRAKDPQAVICTHYPAPPPLPDVTDSVSG